MLKLVHKANLDEVLEARHYGPEALGHHQQLIEAYLQSHRLRNHSAKTEEGVRCFLKAWFDTHGSPSRPLYTWEAMEPVHGRRRIVNYSQALKDSELVMHTRRKYLGHLRGFFEFVIEHPYVFDGDQARRLNEVYFAIEQPVSEYDLPVHAYDQEQLGVPMEPSRLYRFYECLAEHYIGSGRNHHERARNYAMIVLGGESGLRADELAHVEIHHDLFFESHQLQTRFAKGTRGSGKRSRLTVFTPLARDTIRYYIKNHRPFLKGAGGSQYLFCSTNGGAIHYSSMQRAMSAIKHCSNHNGFAVLEHFAWHWLRRLFATRFIERFPDKLSTLIDLLGHMTGQTVHAYIRHSGAWMDEQMQGVLEGIEVDGRTLDP
jgi:site-specific recombinase XerD